MDSDLSKAFDKMVDTHGIIVCKSAGNYGPLFSTILPTLINDRILYIGSMETSETAEVIFKFKNLKASSSISYYSSKGPLINHSRGVAFVAPATSAVPAPQWISKNKTPHCGTSFASPNVAGSIACLLSALRANSIEYSPATIKMALANTAILPKNANKLAYGDGLIQIDAAFEYLKKFAKIIPRNHVPELCLKNHSEKKGIFLIEDSANAKIHEFCVEMKHFYGAKTIPWILKLNSSESHHFIKHSKKVENNSFKIAVNTTDLMAGNIYYSEIHGIHPVHCTLGSIFYFPITVIIPEAIGSHFVREMLLMPTIPCHLFLRPSFKCKEEFTLKLFRQDTNALIGKEKFKKSSMRYDLDARFRTGEKNWGISVKWDEIIQISTLIRCHSNAIIKLEISF